MSKTKTLALNKIRIDGDTQSRLQINEETVEDYAELIRAAGQAVEEATIYGKYERLRRAEAILDERERQDIKWGPQTHPLSVWLAILMEEVGETAAAMLCHRFGNDDHPELDWRKELIQVAAVALSIVEQYEPEHELPPEAWSKPDA